MLVLVMQASVIKSQGIQQEGHTMEVTLNTSRNWKTYLFRTYLFAFKEKS